MKYYDEMKYEEISEILRTSVGALKLRIIMQQQKLKNILTKIKP